MTPCFAALHGARANLHGVCTGCVHIVPGTVFMIWAGVYDSPPDPVGMIPVLHPKLDCFGVVLGSGIHNGMQPS